METNWVTRPADSPGCRKSPDAGRSPHDHLPPSRPSLNLPGREW